MLLGGQINTRFFGIPLSGLLAVALFAGCARQPEPVRETLLVFGSPAEFDLRGADPDASRAAIAAIARRMALREREWHAWQDSDLTRINAALAAGRSVRAPDSIVHAVQRALPLVQASDGLFDPAIGGLIALWGFHRSEFPIREPPPDDAAIAAWLARRPRLTELRLDGDRLGSDNPALQLDLNAIAEGLAQEEIAAILAAHGIGNALVVLGGDVLALGVADSRPWRVGIRDPRGGILAVVELAGREALFSSGGYQRYRQSADGSRWPHLLDPREGRPARASAATAVLDADPVRADAAATALFVAGPAGFAELTARMHLPCALLLDAEDRLWLTSAMARRLRLLRQPDSQAPPLPRGADCLSDTAAPAAAGAPQSPGRNRRPDRAAD